jgi:uncharacterized protein YbjT (DUF2867 family)
VGSVINGDFMKILVTGGTGKVGTEVVQALLRRGKSVRVLTRNKEAKLPDGAEVAIGDLLDPDSVRSALNGVDKLFLLVGNVADELTQALLTVAVAREAKLKHITYLSVAADFEGGAVSSGGVAAQRPSYGLPPGAGSR